MYYIHVYIYIYVSFVLEDGKLYVWGSNKFGQLGFPASAPFVATPVSYYMQRKNGGISLHVYLV